MVDHPNSHFLDIEGVIHEMKMAPTGTPYDPWPFLLEVDDGQHVTFVTVHREDAQQLVEFLSYHLQLPPRRRRRELR